MNLYHRLLESFWFVPADDVLESRRQDVGLVPDALDEALFVPVPSVLPHQGVGVLAVQAFHGLDTAVEHGVHDLLERLHVLLENL